MGYPQEAGATLRGANSTDVAPETAAQTMSRRLAELCGQFASNADRIGHFLDRANGADPKNSSAEKQPAPRAVPNGALAELFEKLDCLAVIAAEQSRFIDRLNVIA